MESTTTHSKPKTYQHVWQLAQQLEIGERLRLAKALTRELQADYLELPKQQLELIAYFEAQLPKSDLPSLTDDELFVGGLTFGEFIALPEVEQEAIWAEAHRVAKQELGEREQAVRADALLN